MAKKSATLDRLDSLEKRFLLLEEWVTRLKETRTESRETVVDPWHYLVNRRHPWRKQLYVKGRNMTARQLVGAMMANGLGEDETAANFRLPVEAVREALTYVEENKQLLEIESEIEALMARREEQARAPGPVP